MSLYSDINTSKTEKFPIVTDIDAVWQSFSNFMNTKPGERLFRPELGCPLRRELLFELDYEEAVEYALVMIVDALEIWDPRIIIDEGETQINIDYDNQKVDMLVVFSIRGFENKIIRKNFTIV